MIETARLLLRPWGESDATAMHDCFGDAETMRFWDSAPTRDIAETTARIRWSSQADPKLHTAFAVMLRETSQVAGMVNCHAHAPAHRRVAVGWIVAPAFRRQGIAHEAVTALLGDCFDRLEAHRIEARIEPDNIPSLRLAETPGFRREGLMRDWLFVDGQPRTVWLYALLPPDWRELTG